MPTTSNFGWTTPADTDLVKDGAAAIRTLGNGVDSSFVDLKGGTTGQILSKNSGTDLDFVWIANDQGDITAVTAGTGISGGGTSGAVTITNSMATEITAKGDLIVGTGNAAFDNLPAGTNGHVLTADSTVSPTGLKWAAPAVSGFVGCKAYLSGNQSITNNTATALTYGSESFDTDAFHSTSTNTSRFTIPSGKGGKYSFDAQVQFNQVAGAEAGLRSAAFFKNGTQVTAGVLMNTSTDESTAFTLSYIADLVATDYVELFVFQTQGGSVNCSGGEANNYCALTFLGA
jgi:hypothetical protein